MHIINAENTDMKTITLILLANRPASYSCNVIVMILIAICF
jgi:hypothetical protein